MLYLDHIIMTANDIEAESEQYGKDSGIKLVKGGEHEDWGTFNYLAHFANNCYLELLGVRTIEKARHLNHPLIKHLIYTLDQGQSGAFQFALRTDNLEKYIQHFRDHHIAFIGPFSGKRRKPNGKLLSWRMLFPEYDYENGQVLPFLIEWDQPEHERIDVSLVNHQAITELQFGGTTKEQFTKVFDLPNKRITGNKVRLRNANIHFIEEPKVWFNFT